MVLALSATIESSPAVRTGKPCLSGTRIAVHDVVQWHLRQGEPLDVIAATYQLSMAGVHTAMAYYYEHADEIDREIDEEAAALETAAAQSESRVQAKLRSVNRG